MNKERYEAEMARFKYEDKLWTKRARDKARATIPSLKTDWEMVAMIVGCAIVMAAFIIAIL